MCILLCKIISILLLLIIIMILVFSDYYIIKKTNFSNFSQFTKCFITNLVLFTFLCIRLVVKSDSKTFHWFTNVHALQPPALRRLKKKLNNSILIDSFLIMLFFLTPWYTVLLFFQWIGPSQFSPVSSFLLKDGGCSAFCERYEAVETARAAPHGSVMLSEESAIYPHPHTWAHRRLG